MMITRRVKFIWGASRVIRGRWFLGLFGLYDREEGLQESGVAISVRGVLLWGGFFAMVAWAAAAFGLFWIWQRNPFSSLTYADAFLYPMRRAGIEEKKGRAFIAQGQEMFRAKNWHAAANLLRIGLERYPRDFRARLTLAQYYLLTNQRPVALRTLREAHSDDYPGRAYLDFLFAAAEQGEDFEAVAEVSARYLPRLQRDGPAKDYRWLIDRRFAALLAAERPAEALALAESDGAGESAREHRVLALLALGRGPEAVAFLAHWREQPGTALVKIVRLHVRAMREAGRFEEMERALAEMRTLLPADPSPLGFAVVQQAMAGRESAANAAFDEYLFRFGGSVENLKLLAAPLAEIGHDALLQRCRAAARERGYPVQPYEVELVHVLLRQGRWDEAAAVFSGIGPTSGRETVAEKAWHDWIQRLLDAAKLPADHAQTALLEFFRERPWPLQVFRRSIEVLMRAERWHTARDLTELATRAFPASKWLKAQSAEIALQITAHAVALPAENVATPKGGLVGKNMFEQRLEALIRDAQWSEAARHIQQVEAIRPVPAWLEASDGAIRLAQIRIGQSQRDVPGMLSAARQFLNGEEARARQLLDLARRYFSEGHRTDAVALAREIVNRSPNFSNARVVLAEWEPLAVEVSGLANKKAVSVPSQAAENKGGAVADEAAELLGHVRARQARGETQAMLIAVRILLNGDRSRSEQVLEVARDFFDLGDKPSAVLLAREVLRRNPGFPPAQRMLKVWEKPEQP